MIFINYNLNVYFSTGGDILNNDGLGSVSIYGDTFPDENLKVNGTKPGFVGMANSGRCLKYNNNYYNTNTNIIIIILDKRRNIIIYSNNNYIGEFIPNICISL